MVCPAKLLTVSRCLPIFVPIFQYVVLLGVVWGGVSVILSCQAVPDILYNSLAITFIVCVDELFYEFVQKVFDVDTELSIPTGPLTDAVEEADLEDGLRGDGEE